MWYGGKEGFKKNYFLSPKSQSFGGKHPKRIVQAIAERKICTEFDEGVVTPRAQLYNM